MYDLQNNFINDKYGNRTNLLFTENYSIYYETQPRGLYKDMKINSNMFNFCYYSILDSEC